MADPGKYIVSYSFSNWQATNPSKPLPAPQVDNELANVATAIGGAVDAITDLRRSDGKLKNGLVTYDALSNDLKAEYTGGAVSAWAPVVAYAAGIAAQSTVPATVVVYSGETYVCIVSHTTTSIFMPSNWVKIAAKGTSGTGSGDMIAANNLSDLASIPQAKANLALNNVNNTSDANKPISTATQTALTSLSTAIDGKMANTRDVAVSPSIVKTGTLNGGDLSLSVNKAVLADLLAGTADKFPDALLLASLLSIRGYANVNQVGVQAARNAYNLTITDTGVGGTFFTFVIQPPSANYLVLALGRPPHPSQANTLAAIARPFSHYNGSAFTDVPPTISGFEVACGLQDVTSAADLDYLMVLVLGG